MATRKKNPQDVTGWISQASGMWTWHRDWSAHMTKGAAMKAARKKAQQQQRKFEVFKVRHGERTSPKTVVAYTPPDKQKNPGAVGLARGKWVKAKAVRVRRVGGRKVIDVRQ